MARLGMAGAEALAINTSTTAQPEPVVQVTGGAVAIEASVVHGGDAAYRIEAAGDYIATLPWAKTANRWVYTRAFVRFDAIPTGANRTYAAIYDGSTSIWAIQLRTDGKFQVSSDSGQLSAVIGPNEWHCLEIGAWGDGSTTKRVICRLDGTQFSDVSSAATPANYGDKVRYGMITNRDPATQHMYVDDLIWNDDTGATNTTWPGTTGKVALIVPGADSAVGTDWKLGTGTTPSGNAYDAVNNLPPLGASNGSAGSDAKQIRDAVNAVAQPAADVDLTLAAYDSVIGISDNIRYLQAVAVVGATAAGTYDFSLGALSNPTTTPQTLSAAPSSAAGAWPSSWVAIRGDTISGAGLAASSQPVVRIGKRTATATTVLCCLVGLLVEYEDPTLASMSGSAAMTFGASATDLGAPIAVVGSSAINFGGAGTLKASGRLSGSSAISFAASVAPPTGVARLTGVAPIVFNAAGGSLGPVENLVGTAPIAFNASVAPPTGIARLSGTVPTRFTADGQLAKEIPSRIPGGFADRWASGLHVGDARPGQRVEVRLGRFNRRNASWFGDDVGVYIPGLEGGKGDVNPWQAYWEPSTAYVAVPNVRDVRLEKSLASKGIGSATLTIDNILYAAQVAGHHEIKRGYLAPLRGYVAPGRDQLVDEQGGPVGENEWFQMLSRSAQITVWQAYGDQEVPVFTGLIDDVDSTSRPDVLTVVARDFGQVLADERVFGWNKEPDVKDPVRFIGRDDADQIVRVGDEAAASSEYGPNRAAANVADNDGDTAWWSAGHTEAGNTEYVQIRLPEGRYSDFYLNIPNGYDGMDVYVSLYVHARDFDPVTKDGENIELGWQGAGDIPGSNGGIPYIDLINELDDGKQTINLDGEYVVGDDTLLRLSFRDLAISSNSDYVAAVTALQGRRRNRDPDAAEFKWVIVDDVADVVKQVLRWAGFKEWAIESTGVNLKKPFLANRGMTYMDVIDAMAEAVGYVFFIADPSGDPDSIGVPTFRKTRAVTDDEPIITVTDRDLLTAVHVQQTDDPLAYIIRVRGRESDAGQELGGDSVKRVMHTFRPPWSFQLPSGPLDRLGGVIRHVIHTNNLFRDADDVKFGAYYIALQEALESIKVSAEFPAFPGLDLDDHLELLDLGTGITSRVLVTDRSSTLTLSAQEARWTMTVGGGLVDTPDVVDMVAIINAAARS